MVRLIEADEYSNGKRYGEFEFTTEQTKKIIDLIQNPFLYCDIKMTLQELETLIADVERELNDKELLENLKSVRDQYAYQRPISTSP